MQNSGHDRNNYYLGQRLIAPDRLHIRRYQRESEIPDCLIHSSPIKVSARANSA